MTRQPPHSSTPQWSEKQWLSKVMKHIQPLSAGHPAVLVGPGDDALAYQFGEQVLLLTSDAAVEQTHFLRHADLDIQQLVQRTVLAAASDITAMGGTPTGFLLTAGLPADMSEHDLSELAEGQANLFRDYHILPLGGDTVSSKVFFMDVTVFGQTEPEELIIQKAAQAGDAIWVTGKVGRMRTCWEAVADTGLIHTEFYQIPSRWSDLAEIRSKIAIRAGTDVSDGLASDLLKLLDPKVGATVELTQIPVAPAVTRLFPDDTASAQDYALAGGEDFELLLVEQGDHHAASEIDLGTLTLTKIGQIVQETGVHYQRQGLPVSPGFKPFEHFPPQQKNAPQKP